MTAAIVAAKRNRIIRQFRRLGATTPYAAISPKEQGIHTGLLFRRLIESKILIETGDHRFYLDELKEQQDSAQRRMIVMIILTILLIFLAVGIITGWFK